MSPGDTSSHSSLTGAVLSPNAVTMRSGADMISALPVQTSDNRREPFPPVYRWVRLACKPLLKKLFNLRVTGLEHLPTSGPFIVAANHHNYVDGVVLGVAVPRPIAFLVMPRVFNASPLHPPFHRRIGSIPVNLERPDPGAIKRVLRMLESGRVVGLFR